MSSSYDMSDRIAASRAEMLAAYHRQRPTLQASTTAVEPITEEQPPIRPERQAYVPPEEPPFGDWRPEEEQPPVSSSYDSTGYLQVHAMAAQKSIPVPDALIVVTQTVNEQEELVALGETDWSGNTRIWPLPAPEPRQFDESDTLADPAFYTVRTFADGYMVVRNLEVPLYGGITVVQEINMIPLPEAQPISEMTFVAGGPADLR